MIDEGVLFFLENSVFQTLFLITAQVVYVAAQYMHTYAYPHVCVCVCNMRVSEQRFYKTVIVGSVLCCFPLGCISFF